MTDGGNHGGTGGGKGKESERGTRRAGDKRRHPQPPGLAVALVGAVWSEVRPVLCPFDERSRPQHAAWCFPMREPPPPSPRPQQRGRGLTHRQPSEWRRRRKEEEECAMRHASPRPQPQPAARLAPPLRPPPSAAVRCCAPVGPCCRAEAAAPGPGPVRIGLTTSAILLQEHAAHPTTFFFSGGGVMSTW